MSITYPDWLLDAMVDVKALCPPDAEPKLTDDEYAQAIYVNVFALHDDEPDTAEPRVDVFGAVHDCWMLKAGKVAGDYQFAEASGMRDQPEQVHAQCLLMADRYNPVGIA